MHVRKGRVGLLAGAMALAVWPACTSKTTELVPGITTQIQVPRHLKTIRLDIQTSGRPSYCLVGSVNPTTGGVTFPATLGLHASDGVPTNLPVTVTVTGYDLAADDPNLPLKSPLTDCLTSPFGETSLDPSVRLFRRSRQPYLDAHTLLVPMPLSYSCWSTASECPSASSCPASRTCSADQTCAASRCYPADVSLASLPDYTSGLANGTDPNCFSAKSCFAGAQPAQVIDAQSCTYGFPVPTEGRGINVEVFYDGGEAEILSQDAREGFTVTDAAKGQFQLAPGLCDLVHNYAMGMTNVRQITAINSAIVCPAKEALQPICASELATLPNLPDAGTSTDGSCNVAQPLVPSPSAVYVLMDNTQAMSKFFGPQGLETVLSLSLNDPVFANTYVAFDFFDHAPADCTGSSNPYATPPPPAPPAPDLFALAPLAQPHVASLIGDVGNVVAGTPPMYVDAALQMNGVFEALHTFVQGKQLAPNRLAVVLILSRPPGADCASGPPSPVNAVTQALAGTDHVYTYVVQVADSQGVSQSTVQAAALATAGGTSLFDATTNPAVGGIALNTIVDDLGSCLYDAPTGLDANSTVSYTNPFAPGSPVTVAPDSTCTAGSQGTANGWNLEMSAGKPRVRICGGACASLKTVLGQVALAALSMSMAVPAVPVVATNGCH